MRVVSLAIMLVALHVGSAEAATPAQSLANGRAAVHRWVDATHTENRNDYRRPVPYLGWPDRYKLPGSVWRAAINWHRTWLAARVQRPLYPWPAWWYAAIHCISAHEEYGMTGHNTSAGYFGMVSSPASYPGSASIVARYGNSWLAIPLMEQVRIVWAEYLTYRWSPWSTAPGCGL